MKQYNWTLGLCVLAVLPGVGCGDSSAPAAIPLNVASTIDEETASAIMSEVVIPVVEAVDLSFLAPAPPPPGGSAKTELECEQNTDVCMSGSLDVCDGGGSDIDLIFAECRSGSGAMIDGSISFSFADSSAMVDFAVSFDRLALSGSVSMAEEAGCLRETLDQFSVGSATRTAMIGASLLYCSGRWPESGEVDVSVTGDGTGYVFNVVFDGSTQATVTVFDLSGSNALAGCMVDLATGRATCEMI